MACDPRPPGRTAATNARRGAFTGISLLLLAAVSDATWAEAQTGAASEGIAEEKPFRRLDAPILPATPFDYRTPLPAHLAGLAALDSAPGDAISGNAASGNAIATLGRVLFHDRQLSRNGLVACASCHTPAFGFDDATRLSIGFEGRLTRRAAMALANVRFNPRKRQFRDERAASLEEQVLDPFTDPVEMGLRQGELVSRVAARPFYRPLFQAAFGGPDISNERIARALAHYVRAIVSVSARYDAARAEASGPLEPFAQFTEAENRGKHLFFTPRTEGGAGCFQCHETEAFVLLAPRNNGLDEDNSRDGGIGEKTGSPAELGLFRTASLKNIAASAPYMHDGRFKTLEEVVEHYASGVKANANLAPELRDADGSPTRLHLSPADRAALVAFLGTLNDDALMSDPRFSDPFLTR